MNDPIDWGALGKQAKKQAEEDARESALSIERTQQQQIARESFRTKAREALQSVRNICETNCGAYNANVNDLRYQVKIRETNNGFVVAKGSGVVHAGFELESLRSQRLTLTRESSMTIHNRHTHQLDVMEIDGTIRFGKVGLEFLVSDDKQLADEACKWVMETVETANG